MSLHAQTSATTKLLLPWLTATGSLTTRFEALAGQPLRVVTLYEGYKPLTTELWQDLALPRAQLAWVRHVQLFGSDTDPWAVAQSFFPVSTLRGKTRRLKHLGNTPLGYVLFGRHKPSCKRIITTTEVDGSMCYTRQNYYNWLGANILVQEAFLPAFVAKLSTCCN